MLLHTYQVFSSLIGDLQFCVHFFFNFMEYFFFWTPDNKKYRVSNKKVFHKSEEKMHKKMKMTLQRAENLVQVQEHYGISFYEKIFFLM